MENVNGSNGKKLIVKSYPQKVDELAIEFDKKLSEMMQGLAASLRDSLKTVSQKKADIAQGKF